MVWAATLREGSPSLLVITCRICARFCFPLAANNSTNARTARILLCSTSSLHTYGGGGVGGKRLVDGGGGGGGKILVDGGRGGGGGGGKRLVDGGGGGRGKRLVDGGGEGGKIEGKLGRLGGMKGRRR